MRAASAGAILISTAMVILVRPSPSSRAAEMMLTGTVTSVDGKALEGVAVSARHKDRTFTTTVYTDRRGRYDFPPLEPGDCRMWAQAVGFATERAEVPDTSRQGVSQDFTLRPLEDFSKQLSGSEWIASLQSDTPQDRRMKAVVMRNCTSCHVAGIALQNRFDKAGWLKMLDFMAEISIFGYLRPGANMTVADSGGYVILDGTSVQSKFVDAYKEELAEYLTKARGPDSTLRYKPMPRPTGEAARVVVTEYDLSPATRPGYLLTHNGSDWSEGTPSSYEASAAHDCWPDQDGNVWFTDDHSPERTIGKLDPRTGRVTSYKLPGKNNLAINSHGIIVDAKGNVWFTNMQEGALSMFDPKTETFQRFPRPESLAPVRSTILLDSKGHLWAPRGEGGAYRLDPKTGTYTEFKQRTPIKKEDPYGIAVDANDNAWFALMNSDRMGYVHAQTGEVSTVELESRDLKDLTAKDRELGAHLDATWNSAPPYQKGPRRLGADLKGNTVWVGLFWAGRLARIDINTRKVKEYPLPQEGSAPYSAIVDKNHMVWVNLMNADRVAKFDPVAERFTEYPLPTLGTETRFISVDDRTDPPTVWLPYYRTNKLARVQFRPVTGGESSRGSR